MKGFGGLVYSVLLPLFLSFGCCSLERNTHPSVLEGLSHYLPIDPQLAQYYNCVTPISIEGLKVISLLQSDFVEREIIALNAIMRDDDIDVVRSNVLRRLSWRKQELNDLRSPVPDTVASLVSSMQHNDKIYLFNFDHPLYRDYGVLVVRDNRIVLRDGGHVHPVPTELDELGFEPGIYEIYD